MEAERYPISARLIGVMHKEKSKMYMNSVLWSDQSDIVVYRTLKEFKKMHKQLKKTFPASKLKQSERVIPKFRANKAQGGGKRKGHKTSVARLKSLQEYCNELLRCDPRVLQSADLIQFFAPKDQDLQPEFTKNSVMIMLSDDESRADAGHGHGGNVTQPFVTESYRCVAPYETKDIKNKPFKVAVDEKVDVLIKDKGGWWLVENETKRMAWFPAPYLERLEDDDDGSEDYIDGVSERGTLCTVIRSYKATKEDEISVNIGVVVEVLQKSDNGWWLIRYNGKVGYIPIMYLKPYNYPQLRMTPNHQEHVGSSLLPVPSPRRAQSPQLQFSPVRHSSPLPLQADSRSRSPSPKTLPEPTRDHPAAYTPAPAYATNVATRPAAATHAAPPPTIMVEMNAEEEQRGGSLRAESEGSLASSSSSEFSFADDLSSSSGSSSLNLSIGTNNGQLRLSRTPEPTASNYLSPTSGPGGRIVPSVSDPNLYKGPVLPKVPPRPQANEIFNRCTTITRKKANQRLPSPTQTEILSH